MLKIQKLDRTGHTVIEENLEAEFAQLVKSGYAMFLNDEHIKRLPDNREQNESCIIALAPLVGG